MVILIIQYNFECEYENKVMVLETVLNIGVALVMLYESFISNQVLAHNVLSFSWSQKNRFAIKVMTAVKKNPLNKIVVKPKIDLINYSYFILLKI